MFKNLKAEMARKSLTLKELAERTGIGYESMKNKMSGATEFKASEMRAIKTEFQGCTLDYLFDVTDETDD